MMALKSKKNDNFVFEEIQKCLKTALYYPAFVGEELDIFLRISGGARISIAKLRRKYHSGEILPDFMLNVVSNSPTDKHLNLLLTLLSLGGAIWPPLVNIAPEQKFGPGRRPGLLAL